MRTPPWVFQSWRLAGAATVTLGLAAEAVAGPAGPAGAAVKPPCCRILTQSVAVGWGSNNFGELGTGNLFDDAVPNYIPVAGLPSGVVQVSGGTGSLALTSDGRVWTWGGGVAPAPVPDLSGIAQISAGDGLNLALRSDGTVWAWGDNSAGDLGNGSDVPSYTPVPVTGLTGVTQIAAGAGMSLALRSDGTVWSWGWNDKGQLGDGSTSNSDVPVRVLGLTHVTRIAAGNREGMAVATRGLSILNPTVYAWGDNSDGQLGDGTDQNRTVPVPVAGLSVQSVASIAVGDAFAMVLGTDGALWAWGANYDGQLGNGTTAPTARPVEVRGPGSGMVQVTAGQYFALARHSDGTVWGWGYNGNGNLGNGTVSGLQTPNPSPVQVTGLSGATQVSAGTLFVLAVHQVRVF
jgi:hypothetical protein